MKIVNHKRKILKITQGNRKSIHIHGFGELILLKWHLTKSSIQIQYNTYQNTNNILHGARTKTILTLIENKRPQTAKAILSKKNSARGSAQDFKIYYGTIVKKTSMVLAYK
jgi:hypothetical protein